MIYTVTTVYLYIYIYVYLLKNFAILGWFQLSLPSYGFYGLWSAMVRLRQTQIIPHLIMDGTNTMSSIAQRGKEGKVLGLLTKTCPLANLGCPQKEQMLSVNSAPPARRGSLDSMPCSSCLPDELPNKDASVGESNKLLSSPKWTWGKGWARAAARR